MGGIFGLGAVSGEDDINSKWAKYLEILHLTDVWSSVDESEGDKYKPILNRLTKLDIKREAEETKIIQEAESWSSRNWHRAQESLPTSDATAIFEAAQTVQLSWASRLLSQRRHTANMLSLGNSNGHLFKAKKVRLGEGASDDPEVLVTSRLRNSRYYLGHAGGDYIFRYKEACSNITEVSLQTADIAATQSPIYDDPTYDAILYTPNVERLPASFMYCGQVPRSTKEYTSRLETVYKDVVKIVESIVCFDQEVDMLDMCKASRQLSTTTMSKNSLVILLNRWTDRFSKDKKYLRWIQLKARNNPRILEFCYLTARLSSNNSSFVQEMSLLVQMLQSATGMGLFNMIEAYDILTAQKATTELLLAGDVSNFMVFDDDTIQDVHAFYDQPHFHSDPLNPCQRFNRPDGSAALEESERLWNSDVQPTDLDLGRENSEVASDPSVSEPITPVQPQLALAPKIVLAADSKAIRRPAAKVIQKEEDERSKEEVEREELSSKSRRLHESEDEWRPDKSPTTPRPKRTYRSSSTGHKGPAKRRKKSARNT